MTRDYYATSRYSDPIAELADGIINDGFAAETIGDVDSDGHYALVDLFASTDADPGLFDRLARRVDLWPGARVIIRTDSQGFVDTYYGPAHPLGDPGAYRALMIAWAELVRLDDATADESAD